MRLPWTTFAFDASGNQRLQIASAGGGTTTNAWDFENRLTKVALSSGLLNTFTYNGDNLRVQRQDSSGTLKAIWDYQKIVEETDQRNAVQVVYTQSNGLFGDLISQRRSGASRYFLFEPLGSAMRLTDGSQSVTDSFLFKAFGEPLLPAGPTTNPFQYVAILGYYAERDLTAYYLRRREYALAIARFMSRDPIGFALNSVNLYGYVNGSPTIAVDPSGLQLGPIIPKIVPKVIPKGGFGGGYIGRDGDFGTPGWINCVLKFNCRWTDYQWCEGDWLASTTSGNYDTSYTFQVFWDGLPGRAGACLAGGRTLYGGNTKWGQPQLGQSGPGAVPYLVPWSCLMDQLGTVAPCERTMGYRDWNCNQCWHKYKVRCKGTILTSDYTPGQGEPPQPADPKWPWIEY